LRFSRSACFNRASRVSFTSFIMRLLGGAVSDEHIVFRPALAQSPIVGCGARGRKPSIASNATTPTK